MLWRGIVWPSSQVQTLVLWDKGISECELWSKSQIILYFDSGYMGKNRNILSSGAPPVTPHLFPSSEAKLYFIPYSVLGRYMNPPPSLCNSASLWNQEVNQDIISFQTINRLSSQLFDWLSKSPRMMFIDCGTAPPWSAVSKRIPNWDFHHCSRLRVAQLVVVVDGLKDQS